MIFSFCIFSERSPGFKIVQNVQAKQSRCFTRILHFVLKGILDEVVIIMNAAAKQIVSLCGSTLRHMKYDTFELDEEGKYGDRLENCRLVMKASAVEDNADNLLAVLKKIMREHWHPQITKQFETTWHTAIQHLLPSLPSEWSVAVSERYVVSLLEELAQVIPKDGDYKYGLKSVYLNLIVRGCLAVHCWKCLLGTYDKNISPSLSRSKQWPIKLLHQAWNWIVCNWDEIIVSFYKPQKFLDVSALQSGQSLGLRLLLVCWCYVSAGNSLDRFKNMRNFIDRIVDVAGYRWGSQVNAVHLPAYLARCPNINDIIWNQHDDEQHIAMKHSYYDICFGTALMNNHKKEYECMIGTALYKDDCGIESDAVNRGSLQDAIGGVFDRYEGSSYVLGFHQKNVIKNTIDGLTDHKYFANVEWTMGLCRKVINLAEEGMAVFFV